MHVDYTVTRKLNFPIAAVWDAWTNEDQLAAWYGPVGFTSPRESVKVDLTIGGFWSATVVVPMDGSSHHFFGRYLEIVEHQKLVYSMFYATDDTLKEALKEEGPAALMTLTFDLLEDGTQLTFIQADSGLPAEEAVRAQAGIENYFDSLTTFLEVK